MNLGTGGVVTLVAQGFTPQLLWTCPQTPPSHEEKSLVTIGNRGCGYPCTRGSYKEEPGTEARVALFHFSTTIQLCNMMTQCTTRYPIVQRWDNGWASVQNKCFMKAQKSKNIFQLAIVLCALTVNVRSTWYNY